MSKPIYKLYVMKANPELEKVIREQPALVQEMLGKVVQSLKEVGAKQVVSCNTQWANEEFFAFGVEEYPDLEAVQKHVEFTQNLGWFQYVQSFTLLGTKQE